MTMLGLPTYAVKQHRKKTSACFVVGVLLVCWMVVVNTRLNLNIHNVEDNISKANSKMLLRQSNEYVRSLKNKTCIFQMTTIVVILIMCVSLYKYIMTH